VGFGGVWWGLVGCGGVWWGLVGFGVVWYKNPLTAVEAGWKSKYQQGTIDSILKRIPMHEPWILHENLAPNLLTPENTDREA
jgi:hypothetical protein